VPPPQTAPPQQVPPPQTAPLSTPGEAAPHGTALHLDVSSPSSTLDAEDFPYAPVQVE